MVDSVCVGRFRTDGGAMFGVTPKTVWGKQVSVDSQNEIAVGCQSLILRDETRVVLLDTGLGCQSPGLKAALASLDLLPEDVTDIVLTHLHFDHAGGLTSRDADGHLQPTFGNARHWIQSEHLDWARGPIEKERGSFPQENIEPIVQADLFALTRGEEELFRGIRVLPLYGHTKAMQAVLIDGERPIFYPADLVPLKAHLYLSNIMAYDVEPLTTLREKKRYLKQALKNNWLVYFEHEPTETFGAIEMFGGEYRLGTT